MMSYFCKSPDCWDPNSLTDLSDAPKGPDTRMGSRGGPQKKAQL